MMAQIAVMRAKSSAYVTMRITSLTGGKPSAVGGSTPAQKRREYCSIMSRKMQYSKPAAGVPAVLKKHRKSSCKSAFPVV